MPIALTADQRAIGEVARSFASDEKLRDATRAALDTDSAETPGASWHKMVELGWAGLHLPAEFGGAGAGPVELAVILDELGAAPAPGGLLASAIGSAVVDVCGTDGLRARLLPGLAGGTIAAFAHADGQVSTDGALTATVTVLGGSWATHLLLGVGADLYVVDAAAAGVQVTPSAGAADPSLGLAVVTVTRVLADVVPGAGPRALAIARTLAAAEASGGSRATLEMALAYAKVREQFGRPIGSFQAIKHHLANMLIEAERVTATAWDAARAIRDTEDQACLAGAVAAAVALPAYVGNAQKNIQILGGVGFTWEHDAHLYLRRAQTLAQLFGGGADDEVFRLTLAGTRRLKSVELPPEAEEFRRQARSFLDRLAETPADARRALLVDTGYLVPHYPRPWGRGAGAVEQLVIEEEFSGVDVPSLGIGGWVLLTLIQCASAEQVERWIRPSLHGELVWCQLFSEPAAGSDAAAVRTKAVRDEGGWRITGQKVWTSGAHYCNRGLATVRTNPGAAKHRGLTTMVIDLTADGVQVRPLREITGEALFNEVFFDDVFVPDADVVGEIDGGWTVARATLGNERVSIGGGGFAATSAIDLAGPAVLSVGRPALRAEVGALIAAEQTLHLINLRQATRSVAGGGPGPEGNVTKLISAEHAQAVSELAVRLAGVSAIDGTSVEVLKNYLFDRSSTIAGGTSEVSRNVIAERLLGLPREAIAN